MKGSNLTLSREYGGAWFARFQVSSDSVQALQDIVDKHFDLLDIQIQKHRERRTLTANAYFHALVNKLATVMKTSNDDMKKWLVRQYGTVAEVNGQPVEIQLPEGTNPTEFYPYCEWLGCSDGFDHYALLKQTHVLNGSEFAKLIDGTVSECKAMGIETLPPDELRRLYAQADKSMRDPA